MGAHGTAPAEADALNGDGNQPTEDRPEFGFVEVCGTPLSIAGRWVTEHGTHVLASLEFDVVSEAADLPSGIQSFGALAQDLSEYLNELVASGEATEYEAAVAAVLNERLAEIHRRWRRNRVKTRRRELLQALRLVGRSGQSKGSSWHRSPPNISAPLSRV
jgi:hypothetical protein